MWAILNDQYGFYPKNSSWTCTVCGQELYGDDLYEGELYPSVMWHCDNCGVLLNKQVGVSDCYSSWICTKCFCENEISEDVIYNSKESYENSNEGKAEDLGKLIKF